MLCRYYALKFINYDSTINLVLISINKKKKQSLNPSILLTVYIARLRQIQDPMCILFISWKLYKWNRGERIFRCSRISAANEFRQIYEICWMLFTSQVFQLALHRMKKRRRRRTTHTKIEFVGWLQNICSTLVQGSVVRRSKPIAYLYKCDFKNRLIIN